ncbi:16S rRNA (uracil(1498)-N(3))-methyltransferase [Maribacter sp. 2307ULW6-5]|uniref:16S rRNA (uracil(1498)-N(3))-methyltransferase n=1 Tax=Maribacter sp. 2307ULW6-5 TaxID=3386275 RepID=UPI0039BCA889
MQLFYSPEISETNDHYTFGKEESRHIIKVLRKKKHDPVHLTNGKGDLFKGEIVNEDAKQCKIKIVEHKKHHPERHYLHLAVAPTKMNDRYEWFVEKATEIGVHEITPLICERSERKTVKMERLARVAQAAMKQSLQTFLPKINAPVTFADFMEQPLQGLAFIAHCEATERHELKRRVAADRDVTLIVGPEGDFSTEEIKKAIAAGYHPVSLGKTRLRTETAAIVACATVALVNNT